MVRLTFYTAPVSLACLLPFYWLKEVGCRCQCGPALDLWHVAAAVFNVHANLIPNAHLYHADLHLQRDAFLDYALTHRQGVTFIVLTTSINAVLYNLVREKSVPDPTLDTAPGPIISGWMCSRAAANLRKTAVHCRSTVP